MAKQLSTVLQDTVTGKLFRFPITIADLKRVQAKYGTEADDIHLVYEVSKRLNGPYTDLPLFHDTEECFADHYTNVSELDANDEVIVVNPLAKGSWPDVSQP